MLLTLGKVLLTDCEKRLLLTKAHASPALQEKGGGGQREEHRPDVLARTLPTQVRNAPLSTAVRDPMGRAWGRAPRPTPPLPPRGG